MLHSRKHFNDRRQKQDEHAPRSTLHAPLLSSRSRHRTFADYGKVSGHGYRSKTDGRKISNKKTLLSFSHLSYFTFIQEYTKMRRKEI
jgi:hypothetical protein